MSDRRIRICRTHDSVMNADRRAWGGCHYALWAFASGRQAVGSDIPTNAERIARCDDIVEMVWSSDGSALLAVTECDECDGTGRVVDSPFADPTFNEEDRVPLGYLSEVPCPKCGGRGYTYQANIRDINMWTDSPKVAVGPL